MHLMSRKKYIFFIREFFPHFLKSFRLCWHFSWFLTPCCSSCCDDQKHNELGLIYSYSKCCIVYSYSKQRAVRAPCLVVTAAQWLILVPLGCSCRPGQILLHPDSQTGSASPSEEPTRSSHPVLNSNPAVTDFQHSFSSFYRETFPLKLAIKSSS